MKRGHVLLGLGILLLLAGYGVSVTSMTTFTVDTEPPLIYYVFPAGTFDEPSPMTEDSYFEMGMWVGDTLSGVASAPAYVEIYGDESLVQSFYLPYAGHTGVIDGVVYGKYEKWDWRVPFGGGVFYRFHFIATDKSGNTATVDKYGLTGTPDGYFAINGVVVAMDTHLYLNTRTVTFQFFATSKADEVYDVVIDINQDGTPIGSLSLTHDNETVWSTSYTFTADGEYEVIGSIIPTYNHAIQYRKMSIITDTGRMPVTVMPKQVLYIAGAALVLLGSADLWRKKKH